MTPAGGGVAVHCRKRRSVVRGEEEEEEGGRKEGRCVLADTFWAPEKAW